MVKKQSDPQILVRLKKDINNKVKALADKQGLTKSSWVRLLIIRTVDAENGNG